MDYHGGGKTACFCSHCLVLYLYLYISSREDTLQLGSRVRESLSLLQSFNLGLWVHILKH